jgi:pimeloyl-ACP methyl ester carboxylesterase
MLGQGQLTGEDSMKLSFMLTLALLFAACGDNIRAVVDSGPIDAPAIADAPPPPDVDPNPIPRLESATCRFNVPDTLGLEGTDYECGELVVYEDRDALERAIRVHYIRVFSAAVSTNATIYLDGGPGGNGNGILTRIGYFGASFRDGLLSDGDFLVIAQRGTNLSQPSLMCPGGDCSGLSQVADLPSYNTGYNADDVNDLRATLGYDKLNLYGISYGSRLGLEVMRRHGNHLRSSVIGGLVPAQVVWPAQIPASFYSALTALDASCAAAGGCGDAFGDLEAKLIAGVSSLNAEPLLFYYEDEPIELDGLNYAYLLFDAFYSKSTFEWLPLVISDIAARRSDRVGDFLGHLLERWSVPSSISRGLYYSVVCGELFNPPDASAFDDANADVPVVIRDTFAYSYYGIDDTCASWPVGDPRPALSEPVTSDVRTLVASGALDPITPPSFGELAASTLSDRVAVVFANSGHGATLQTSCGQQTMLAFLADPSSTPDTACAEAITTDYILPSRVTGRAPDWQRIALELDQAPLPPHMRDRLESAGSALR